MPRATKSRPSSPSNTHGVAAALVEFSAETPIPTGPAEFVERPARLFKSGDYPDKGVSVSGDDLDAMVAASSALSEIPIDLAPHGNSDVNLPVSFTGGVIPTSIKRVGEFIDGVVKMPQNVYDALKVKYPERIPLSVVFNRVTRAIKKVAVVPKGRVAEAAFSADEYCFDGEMPMADQKTEPPAEPSDPTVKSVDAGNIKSAIDTLAQLGLVLPDDTTPDNLVERIVTAGNAVIATKAGSDQQTQQNEREVPAPIAMGNTMEKPKSDIVFAAPATLNRTLPKTHILGIRNAYRQEIERHVNRGAITPQYANEVLAPFLGTSPDDVSFADSLEFDEDLRTSHKVLDQILMAVDRIPDGSILCGTVAEVERRTKTKGKTSGDVKFSLKILEHEEQPPAEFNESAVLDNDGKPTEEQAAVTAEMTRMANAQVRKQA